MNDISQHDLLAKNNTNFKAAGLQCCRKIEKIVFIKNYLLKE